MTTATVADPATAVALTRPHRTGTLRQLFRAYRGKILLTYALFNIENLLRLTQPLLLGWAVSGLLAGLTGPFLWFASHQLGFLVLSAARRLYDTRAFTTIYADLAIRLVQEQRVRGVDPSQVAARSALSRQIVEFFERDVPILLQGIYSLAGALVMLAAYDSLLVASCLALLVPAWVLGHIYGRKTFALNRRLHDELEREVEVIDRGRSREIASHYQALSRWRVRLSDAEALTFGLGELGMLLLLGLALMRSCSDPAADAGQISAVLGYILMFGIALLNLPVLAGQQSRLSDICRRLQGEEHQDKCAR